MTTLTQKVTYLFSPLELKELIAGEGGGGGPRDANGGGGSPCRDAGSGPIGAGGGGGGPRGTGGGGGGT